MSKPATLQCPKCGWVADSAVSECRHCGGRLVKVCGGCGFKNSIAKNYCDRCGSGLMELASGAADPAQFPTPAPGAPEPAGDIPMTVIRRKDAPKADSPALPPAAKAPEPSGLPLASQAHSGPEELMAYPPPPPAVARSRTSRARTTSERTIVRAKNAPPWHLALVLGLGALGAGAFWWHHQPARAVPRAAAQYLNLISAGDAPAAYARLSAAAMANASPNEFQSALPAAPWSWSALSIVRQEEDAAFLRYALTPEEGPPEERFLFFTLEDGRWVVPDNRTSLSKASAALLRQDSDLAILLAQAAVRINPRDPEARCLLCQSYDARKQSKAAAKECELALKVGELYPVPEARLDRARGILARVKPAP